jgi:hypothetical protein
MKNEAFSMRKSVKTSKKYHFFDVLEAKTDVFEVENDLK